MAHSQRLNRHLPWMPRVQVLPESQTVKLDFNRWKKPSGGLPPTLGWYRRWFSSPRKPFPTLKDILTRVWTLSLLEKIWSKLGTVTLEYAASPAERLLHVLLGIYYYQEVNGEYHPLLGSGAVRILKVVRVGSGCKETGAEK